MSYVRSHLSAVLTALILLVISSTAHAQTSKGFIVGNVTDPNGAAVEWDYVFIDPAHRLRWHGTVFGAVNRFAPAARAA